MPRARSPLHHDAPQRSGAGGQAPGRPPSRDMLWVPGGTFSMGSNAHYPEEAPLHRVRVEGFWMDRTPVTNAQFLKFVKATGHLTLAERPADPALYPDALPDRLVPSSIVFVLPGAPVRLGDPYRWWQYVAGAHWRHPEGPGSSIKGREHHPVVHIAYEDALAYATWAGKALPSEAEWERAAWGGLEGVEFAWGSELHPGGQPRANTWQGTFPHHNSRLDGWERTSPVGSFPANGFGLLDMIGNVWEWTDDWYQEHRERLAASAGGGDSSGEGERNGGAEGESLRGAEGEGVEVGVGESAGGRGESRESWGGFGDSRVREGERGETKERVGERWGSREHRGEVRGAGNGEVWNERSSWEGERSGSGKGVGRGVGTGVGRGSNGAGQGNGEQPGDGGETGDGGCCASLKESAHAEAEAEAEAWAEANSRQRSIDPASQHGEIPRKVVKGGSFLCAPNYCQRYRPAARLAQGIDTSTCHMGFRCIVRPG